MGYDKQQPRLEMGHHVLLEDRERLVISGVEEVESFDESTIVLLTGQGGLEIQGEGLHIEQLSLDGGELRVHGLVSALVYEVERRERGGLFGRLLGR